MVSNSYLKPRISIMCNKDNLESMSVRLEIERDGPSLPLPFDKVQ